MDITKEITKAFEDIFNSKNHKVLDSGLRYVEKSEGDKTYYFIEQNPDKDSKYGRMVKNNPETKIVWCISGGEYLAVNINGVVELLN